MLYYRAEFSEGIIRIPGFPDDDLLYEVPRINKFKNLYDNVLHLNDLNRALCYLDCMVFNNDKHYINEGLFNAAIISYFKCFTYSKGRGQLNYNSVYKDIENGNAIKLYNHYKKLRDEFIAHDENDYAQSKVGIIVNTRFRKVMQPIQLGIIAYIAIEENRDKLKLLIEIAIKVVESKIDLENERLFNEYKNISYDELSQLDRMIYKVPE